MDDTGARAGLSWGEVYTVDAKTAVSAAEIADKIGMSGPVLDGFDAVIAVIGRELGAPVVAANGDLTYDETKRVIDIEAY